MKMCDIAFMPLLDNDFNKKKSDLKAVEAASFGLAILSNPVVYGNTFNQENAAFFETSNQLEETLRCWANDPNLVRKIGQRSRRYVSENRLFCYQNLEKLEWYESLWERREELNNQLKSRLNKL